MKRALKVVGGIAAVLLLLIIGVVIYVLTTWNRTLSRPASSLSAPHDPASVARGKYLFTVSWQCFGCHQSGPENPEMPPSGGRAFDLRNIGPGFGIFYSRNITPDSATGIGAWTDGEIVQAIREGVNRSRHTLFPIMPTAWLHELSDADALALVAYLRSIPPVHKEVPPREPSFVAKALLAFSVIAPAPPVTQPVSAPPAGITAEYGHYVATAGAGCADCHTPRNLQNGDFYFDSLFAGGSFPMGDAEGAAISSTPHNIRPHSTDGIGRWTEEEFITAVTSGVRPDSTVLASNMPYAMYKYLAVDDLRAIYLYLKSLPPLPRFTPAPQYSRKVGELRGSARGELLFEARCQGCHGLNGTATHVTNVKLAEATPIYSDTDLRETIRTGVKDLKMPSFRRTLTDDELNDIVSFIRTWKRE